VELSHYRCGDVVVASVSGRVDHANAEPFRSALWPLLESCAQGRDRLLLDLGRLDYISSAGLRVLMLAARQVKQQGGTVAVAGLGSVVQEIFEISRFTLVFPVFETVAAGLSGLSGRPAL
jgi:anti-anti-sigma factor